MIGTKMTEGFGLGNQLFFYVTTRCIALDKGLEFSILGSETMANNMHSDCGLYFMDLDYGCPAEEKDFTNTYYEHEDRLFVGNSTHDLTHGAYVTGTDWEMWNVPDQTILVGNMQSEDYYLKHADEVKKWLKVKPEYDCMEYSKDNLCVIHLRCSDYLDSPELFLRKKYWRDGMKYMKKLNPDMEFMIITNDTKEASKILPGIPAYNFDLAKDYSIIKNAKYLLLANSSFSYFPAFTSETCEFILAPKYWARHNVSNGYWASEQNIYSGWHYMDRFGKVFTSDECKEELAEFKKTKKYTARLNVRPTGVRLTQMKVRAFLRAKTYRLIRIMRSIKRKMRMAFGG